jgi:TolB-like protein
VNSQNFFSELRRRNVYKVAVAYIVSGWALSQGIAQVFPVFDVPNWVIRLIVLLIIIGLPVALFLAWTFELTSEGIKRTEDADPIAAGRAPKKHAWIYIVLIGAAISIGLFFVGRYTATNSATLEQDASPARTEAAAQSGKSIAVLPFENLSSDKENAYFADGIQDQILTRLAKIADLKVISRTSTRKYGSAPDNLRQIAQQLGVANILEGSVQKSADQVRITVQLISAVTDSHLWAETFDRKLTDVFSVESDVAQRIASSLEAKLSGREKTEIATIRTKDPGAYDAYLHAIALSNGQDKSDLDKCIEYAQRAVALDASYAEAWALLSISAAQRFFVFGHSPADSELARTAADRAIALQPDLSRAHTALGSYYYYCLQDYERALGEFDAARESSPNDALTLQSVGMVERRQGRLDESVQLQEQAAALDPLNQDIWVNLGRSYGGQRKLTEARAMYERALTIAPNDPNIKAEEATVCLAEGDVDAAARLIDSSKIAPNNGFERRMLSVVIYRRQFDPTIALLSQSANLETIDAVRHAQVAFLHIEAGRSNVAHPILVEAEDQLGKLHQKGLGGGYLLGTLLQVHASLGNRAAVDRESAELLNLPTKDVWGTGRRVEAAARGYAMLQDAEHAVPILTRALTTIYSEALTPAQLRLDPVWDTIRSDPRFQKLCEEKAK